MNYWIETKPKELAETMKFMDVIIVNDSEARLLTHEPNLIKAAKKIIKMGPQIIIIKKGEHGAMLVTDDTIFSRLLIRWKQFLIRRVQATLLQAVSSAGLHERTIFLPKI